MLPEEQAPAGPPTGESPLREAARQSEERAALALKAGHVGVFDWDIAGGKIVWTSSQEEIFGLPSGTFTYPYEAWVQSVPEEDLARLTAFFLEWMDSEREEEQWEYRYLRPDGTMRWISARGILLRDAQGRAVRMIGTNQDITERKQREEARERSLGQLQAVLDNMPEGVVVTDVEGNVLAMNAAALALHEYQSIEEARRWFPQYQETFELFDMSGKPLPLAQWPISRALRGEIFDEMKVNIRRKDLGQTRLVSFSGRPVSLPEKGPMLGVLVVRDITERERALEALKASEAKFRIVADNTYDWEYWTNPEGQVLYTSPSCLRITGHTAQEFQADPELLYEIIHPEDQSAFREHRRLVTHSKISGEIEFRIILPDGTERWIAHVCQPAYSPDRHYLGVRASNRDITERKQAEKIMETRFRLVEMSFKHRLEDLLVATLDEAEAMTGSQVGFYHFLEEDQKTLSLQAWSTRTTREMCSAVGAGRHYDVDEAGVWVDCIHQRRPVVHNDYEALPHRKGLPPGHAPVIRELVVPVFRGEKIVAILGVGNKPALYTEEDVQTVSRLADIAWDIAERKRAEEALRTSEEEFRALAEAMPHIVWATRPDGWNIYFNQQWVQYTGLTLEESYGSGWITPFHPDDRQRAWDAWQSATQNEAPYALKCRLRRADGVYRWWLILGVPQRDEHGRILKWFGTCTDIEDLKKAEEALRTSEARFKSMFDEAPLGIAVVDSLNGRFYSVNPMFAKIAGRTVEEMEQIDWISITHPDDIQEDLDRMAAINEGKATGFQMEKRYRRPDGSFVWINMTIANIYVEDKAHPRHLLMIEDITGRKALREELKAALLSAQRAKDVAEAANRAKDEFIAVLSHELRTPLTPVLATVSALQEQEEIPVPLRSDMELIRRNVEMETALIDDLLDVTRIRQGKIVLKQETVDVRDCLGTALEICGAEITSKRLEIRSEFHAEQHHVRADPARLRQVFWNLLKNAVKFTPAGGRITLRTHNVGDRLKIEIIDTGIGIEAEVLPRIFNLFEQGEQSRIRQFGGLGLGLHIARAVVELHEGRLTAFSEGSNKGATFTVELATVPSQEKAAPPSPVVEPKERPLRILLVEDHPDTLRVLVKLLQKWGHAVTTAETVRTAQELANGQEFDLLISDLGLPDGSGLDVMRHVKERSGIPGIALSGYGTEEDIRRSRAAGFTEHLVKPVNISALRTAIQRFAHASS